MPKTRRILIIGIAAILIGMVVAIWFVLRKDDGETSPPPSSSANSLSINTTVPLIQSERLAETPIATIETPNGTMKIRFFTTEAPELTKNFIELAKSGYYDGLTFHRVIPGFVIQGGDPVGDGTGGHSYKGEGVTLGDEAGALELKHVRGAVAWAKSQLPNSIGSQFYIALDDLTHLDGKFSVFGQVVEGIDVADRIAAVPASDERPRTPVRMTKVTIEE